MAQKITIRIPGPDEPGYLRRMRLCASAQEKLSAGDLGGYSDLVNLFAELVQVEEGSGMDPREQIEMLSLNEFEALMDQLASAGKLGNESGGN